ncbi:uncharacterized protein LOC134250912 [Saccostrea cucullata]|uniref:uncharacterized protein LOC134250912 n=1 Tax=Saccostrea cuccullata TaxID=36930 RepID=UPI002ED06CA9
MEMPAHCSHWLQPLDRTVFGPLKKKWKEINATFTSETACPTTHANFFRLFSRAWVSLKPAYLINGFRVTGISPWNPKAIPEEAYLPSQLYNANPDYTERGATVASVTPSAECHPALPTPAQCPMTTDILPFTAMPKIANTAENTVAANAIPINQSEVNYQLEEIPQLSSEEVQTLLDMGFFITVTGSSIQQASDDNDCPPDLALAAIECSLTEEKRKHYEICFALGVSLDKDPIFHTWKSLKSKLKSGETAAADSDVLGPIPHAATQPKSKRDQSSKGFFVISCDEAYHEKLLKEEEKKERERKKKLNAEKRRARINKNSK